MSSTIEISIFDSISTITQKLSQVPANSVIATINSISGQPNTRLAGMIVAVRITFTQKGENRNA